MRVFRSGLAALLIITALAAAGCAPSVQAALPQPAAGQPEQSLPEPTAASAGSASMSVILPEQPVKVGQTFTLEVAVKSAGSQVDAAQASLDFDPALLRVVAINPGAALTTLLQNQYDNAAGTIDFAAGALPPAAPGSGDFTLVQVEMLALAPADDLSISFHFELPRASGLFFQGNSVLASNGTFNGKLVLQPE